MKRKLWRAWQGWLIVSIPMNIISLIIAACCFDSDSIIPIIVAAVNLIWLTIIIIANSDRDKNRKRREYKDEFIDKGNCA